VKSQGFLSIYLLIKKRFCCPTQKDNDCFFVISFGWIMTRNARFFKLIVIEKVLKIVLKIKFFAW
jgi:hypothetical protein